MKGGRNAKIFFNFPCECQGVRFRSRQEKATRRAQNVKSCRERREYHRRGKSKSARRENIRDPAHLALCPIHNERTIVVILAEKGAALPFQLVAMQLQLLCLALTNSLTLHQVSSVLSVVNSSLANARDNSVCKTLAETWDGLFGRTRFPYYQIHFGLASLDLNAF